MGPLSVDLRKRVVSAVREEGISIALSFVEAQSSFCGL